MTRFPIVCPSERLRNYYNRGIRVLAVQGYNSEFM